MHTGGVQTPRLVAVTLSVACATVGLAAVRAEGATLTAEYVEGYRDVRLNGYRARGLGTFRLRDGDATSIALCIESDVGHSNLSDAYESVPNRVASPELDALLWWLARQPALDADTAVAAAALAWYHAGAQRSIGGLVWADTARGWSAIGPLDPEPWDALAPFGLAHPVGLLAGDTDLEAAERRVAQLARMVVGLAGPWSLAWDGKGFVVTAGGVPVAGHPVAIEVRGVGDIRVVETVLTDAHGRAIPPISELPAGGVILGSTETPGVHREWDGPGPVQRMATPSNAVLSDKVSIATPPTTSTTTTTTSTTAPTTVPPPTTSTTTSTPAPTTTTPSTTSTTTSTIATTTSPPSTAPPPTAAPTTPPATPPPTTAPPATSAPATTAPTTATTTSTTVAVAQAAPAPPTLPDFQPDGPAALPSTGGGSSDLLHVADGIFVLGVLLVALAGLTRRRTSA